MRTQDDYRRIFAAMTPFLRSIENIASKEGIYNISINAGMRGADVTVIEEIEKDRNKHVSFQHIAKVEEQCIYTENIYSYDDKKNYVKEKEEDPFELQFLDVMWEGK